MNEENEIIENLDFLMNLEVLENPADWNTVEDLPEIPDAEKETDNSGVDHE